jgi:4-hydroxythreonine-4-phosphate dehydrogenase
VSRPGTVPTLAVTTGEPAGIGPDLCAAIAARPCRSRVVLLGDRRLLGRVRGTKRLMNSLPDYDPAAPARRRVEVLHAPLAAPCTTGRLDTANARYVLGLLDRATDGCLSGEFDAMVTAPVHKGIVNDAGISFSGHTEYLAGRCGVRRPVMMLAGGGLRVALATTHLPLAEVPATITADMLASVLRILDADLRRLFAIRRPRILVCGLNPHAGEGGHLGREEIDVIGPVVARLRRSGLDLRGPVPADTAFLPAQLADCDAVLAMYHDQGLPVLKRAAFGDAVNLTLGLPIVRTSVDHGTALELAGSGRVDPGSMLAALDMAARICRPSRR